MKNIKIALLIAFIAITLSPFALADSTAKKPSEMSDRSWATFSGKVTHVMPDRFVLDYGKGNLTVEVDDGDFDNDAYKFFEGDNVTVTGRIDKNLFAKTTLEASSIYVEGLNSTFFSSAIDEEDMPITYISAYIPIVSDTITLTGSVKSVSQLTNSLTIDVDGENVTIDLSALGYDPLDDEGFLKVANGDKIKVVASFDEGFFNNYHLDAQALIKLDS